MLDPLNNVGADRVCGIFEPYTRRMKVFELLLENSAKDVRESHNETDVKNMGYSDKSAGYSEILVLRARIEEKDKQIVEKDRHISDKDKEIEFLKGQITIKDQQIDKQAFSLQSVIQENSRLNVKLLPESTEVIKKRWRHFW